MTSNPVPSDRKRPFPWSSTFPTSTTLTSPNFNSSFTTATNDNSSSSDQAAFSSAVADYTRLALSDREATSSPFTGELRALSLGSGSDLASSTSASAANQAMKETNPMNHLSDREA